MAILPLLTTHLLPTITSSPKPTVARPVIFSAHRTNEHSKIFDRLHSASASPSPIARPFSQPMLGNSHYHQVSPTRRNGHTSWMASPMHHCCPSDNYATTIALPFSTSKKSKSTKTTTVYSPAPGTTPMGSGTSPYGP